MQLSANMITIDDPLSARDLVQRMRNKNQQQAQLRNSVAIRKERNLSARLPKIEKPRYEDFREAMDMNVLNFIKASRRQMKEVVHKQTPQVHRFYDSTIFNDTPTSTIQSLMKDQQLLPQQSPNFRSQKKVRLRPSFHSLSNSMTRDNIKANLNKLDECSDVSATEGRQKDGPFQLQQNKMQTILTPQASFQKQISSAVSLLTDNYKVDTKACGPISVHTAKKKLQNSPSAAANSNATLGRELKQINNYLDVREMQIRSEFEETLNLDIKLEQTKNLKQLYQQVMSQVRTKLSNVVGTALSEMVKRLMEGLNECFQNMESSFEQKIDSRDRKIEALEGQLAEIKIHFAEFQRESTIDAFFKKHTKIVDRTGRREKDYMKDLNKFVDEYLNQKDMFESMKVSEELQKARDAEPSGAETLLVQLHQHQSKVEIPTAPENPLNSLDAEKDHVMNDFKRALNHEFMHMADAVEHKVKVQMGLVKPSREVAVQTQTFKSLKYEIIEKARFHIEQIVSQQSDEKFQIKLAKWLKDIEVLQDKNSLLKQKMLELQEKLRNSDGEMYVNYIREKITAFFNMKLGKQGQVIMKEFNQKVMEIQNTDVSVNRVIKQIQSYHQEQTMIARQQLAGQYDGIVKSVEQRTTLLAQQQKEENERIAQMEMEKEKEKEKEKQKGWWGAAKPQTNTTDPVEKPGTKQSDVKVTTANKEVVEEVLKEESEASQNYDVDESPSKLKKSKKKEGGQRTISKTKSRNPEEEPLEQSNIAKGTVKKKKKTTSKNPRKTSPDNNSPSQNPEGAQEISNAGSQLQTSDSKISKQSKVEKEEAAPSQVQAAPTVISAVETQQQLLARFNGIEEVLDHVKQQYKNNNLQEKFFSTEKTIAFVNGLESATDVLHQIVKLSTKSTSSELYSEANELKIQAFDQYFNQKTAKETLEKLRRCTEIHKLCFEVNQFVKNAEKDQKQSLPERNEIFIQLANFQKVKNEMHKLPTKEELKQTEDLEKNCTSIQNKITDLIQNKFIQESPNIPIVSDVPTLEVQDNTSKKPASSVKVDSQEMTDQVPKTAESIKLASDADALPASMQTNNIPDVITRIKQVRNKIEDSHFDILNAEHLEPKDQKLHKKVNEMLLHFDETVKWLDQRYTDSEALLVVSDSEEDLPVSQPQAEEQPETKKTSVAELDGVNSDTTPPQGPQTANETEGDPKIQDDPESHIANGIMTAESKLGSKEQTETKKAVISKIIMENTSEVHSVQAKLRFSQEAESDEEQLDRTRVEVFRKTPIKPTTGSEEIQKSYQQNVASESTPMSLYKKQSTSKKSLKLDEEQLKQRRPSESATQTPPQTIKDRSQIDQTAPQDLNLNLNSKLHKNLRQSANTDYLATASSFQNETYRADVNPLITNSNQNPNESHNFLMILQNSQMEGDQQPDEPRIEDQNKKNSDFNVLANENNRNISTRNKKASNVNDQKYIEASQTSSIADLELLESPLYHSNSASHIRDKGVKKFCGSINSLSADSREVKVPSQLKISQKPVHSLIKVENKLSKEYLGCDLNEYSQLSSKITTRKPLNSVLMLTQSTQTENRALIKELLTIINETILQQLKRQANTMTINQYKDQVNMIKKAIPTVYEQMKRKSDSQNTDKILIPKYTTNDPSDQPLMVQKEVNHNMNEVATSRDLPKASRALGGQNYSSGVIVAKQSSSPTPQLGSTPSRDMLQNKHKDHMLLIPTPSKQQLEVIERRQQQQFQQLKQPYINLEDFRRYGSHTLEITDETRKRVNLRQVGAAGGGFMGRGVKVPVPQKK